MEPSITLLAVTGLTHRQAYKDVFVITFTKTVAVFVAIAFFYSTGILLRKLDEASTHLRHMEKSKMG